MKANTQIKMAFLITVLALNVEFRIDAQQPLDGRARIFHDTFLDNLSGEWKLNRTMKGVTYENRVSADWVLNHQFLQLHMTDVNSPPAYEALVFIGYDNSSERYVVHWIDQLGGRWSETLGYGTRMGNSIKFVWEYPDGPFVNTFSWSPETKTWTFYMRQKNPAGVWVDFGIDRLRRA